MRRNEAESIIPLVAAAFRATSPKDQHRALASALTKLVDAQGVTVLARDPDARGAFRRTCALGVPPDSRAEQLAIKAGQGPSGALVAGEPREDGGIVIIPVRVGGEISLLFLARRRDRFRGPRMTAAAKDFAQIAAVVSSRTHTERDIAALRRDLERANREISSHQRERSREMRVTRLDLELRVKRLAILYQVARTLSSSLDLPKVLDTIVKQAARHLQARKASVMLVREGSDQMVINAHVGLKEWVVRRTRLKIGEGIAGKVAADLTPILVEELEEDPRFQRRRKSTYRTGSLISVPMVMAGNLVGVMNVADKEGGGAFSREDLDLLAALGDQAAVAVHQARLFGEVSSGRDTLAALYGRLEAEQSKTFLVLAGIADGVIAVGTDGEILSVNPAAATYIGVPPDELIGTSLALRRMTGPMIDLLREHHRKALRGEVISRISPVELNLETSTYIEMRTSPLKAAGFPVMGTVTIFHDVTELKRLDEMKTEFISRASHELRTPIAIVKGFLETIVSHPDLERERIERFVGMCLKETNRLAELTEALLDLSRLEAGRRSLELVRVDLAELVDEVVRETRQKAAESALTVSCRKAGSAAAVLGDRMAIRQIMHNLISNALKFTPRGGKIEIATRVRDRQAELAVKDNGVGIPAEHLPRIFEKFYRGAQEQTGIPGSGLGLSIVKELIEAMKGGISVKSEPGKGTRVEVWFPVAEGGGGS